MAAMVTLAILAVPATALAAADLRRCEDANGHVTYSNESCPTGTAKERGVENRPAVEVPHDSSERASAAGKGGGIVPSAHTAEPRTPETVKEMDQEQRKALVAKCDDLVHRIEYGQQDLLTAAPSERASVELGLRRLQQEHESLCAAPKTAQ